VPICGALRVIDSDIGYPIVDSIVRFTPELAHRYREWLVPLGLRPPDLERADAFQPGATVESFGFQWSWNRSARTETDLLWRVATRFGLTPADFDGALALDAGAGAGDQSRWMLDHGASVVSVDLSDAIQVVAGKLRLRHRWVGVQGDITASPFASGTFELVYCEGVIQHTRDSALTVAELSRVLRPDGKILATHYDRSPRVVSRLKVAAVERLRRGAAGMDPFKLLLLTGNLAALAHVPVLGPIVVRTGLAIRYPLMPDFKTTWTNTFDQIGTHAYQRYVTPQQFESYFNATGSIDIVRQDGTLVVGRKRPAPQDASVA
jgi:SAM-dependent methyltransferase